MNSIGTSCQFQTPFGIGYMAEHHSDELRPSLLLTEPSERDLASVLQRLRSALGIRRLNAG